MQEPFPNFPTEPPQKPAGEPLPPQEETGTAYRTAGSTSAKSITAGTEQPRSTSAESITAGTEHAAE